MTAAYGGMSERMPDNGRQIVMFTHQDAGVWADMASIVWGAGFRLLRMVYRHGNFFGIKEGRLRSRYGSAGFEETVEQDSAYRDELVQEYAPRLLARSKR